MFTKDSALAKIWVRNVRQGNYTRDQVPNLSNIREIIYAVLEE